MFYDVLCFLYVFFRALWPLDSLKDLQGGAENNPQIYGRLRETWPFVGGTYGTLRES